MHHFRAVLLSVLLCIIGLPVLAGEVSGEPVATESVPRSLSQRSAPPAEAGGAVR